MSLSTHIDSLGDERFQVDSFWLLVGANLKLFRLLRSEVGVSVALRVLENVRLRTRCPAVFLQQAHVVSKNVFEAGVVVNSFQCPSDARVGAHWERAHGDHDFRRVGHCGSTTLVELIEGAFPFIRIGEDVAKASGCRRSVDILVHPV